MNHIDVMKQALEALEQWNTPLYKRGNVITALRRALEALQHPDAPQRSEDKKQWVGLTDVEWMNIINKDHAWFGQRPEDVAHEVAKLVEAKLKEKNNG